MRYENNPNAELAAACRAYQETRKAINYGHDYDLSQLVYLEWRERTGKLYGPIGLPAFVRGLLDVLHSLRGRPATEAAAHGPQQAGCAGAGAAK